MEKEDGEAIDLFPLSIPNIMCNRDKGLTFSGLLHISLPNFNNDFGKFGNELSKIVALNGDNFLAAQMFELTKPSTILDGKINKTTEVGIDNSAVGVGPIVDELGNHFVKSVNSLLGFGAGFILFCHRLKS